MIRTLVVLVLIGLGLSGSALAEEVGRPRHYVSLGGSYALENFSLTSQNLGLAGVLGPSATPNYDNSAGFDFQIGYRIRQGVAVEFLYGFIEGFDSHEGLRGTEIDLHLVVLNVKWFPLDAFSIAAPAGDATAGCKLQPYGLLGVGTQIVNSEVLDPTIDKPWSTDAGFVGRVGAGLDYHFTDTFAVELEASYMIPAGGWVKHTDYASFALHFLHSF